MKYNFLNPSSLDSSKEFFRENSFPIELSSPQKIIKSTYQKVTKQITTFLFDLWSPLTSDIIAYSDPILKTQCGNFMIFVSFTFSVKLILRILEVQNKPF